MLGLLGTPNKLRFSDSFNRADNAAVLGMSDSGHTPSVGTGGFGISSNQAYHAVASGGRDYALWDSGVSNGYFKCTFPSVVVNQRIAFRVATYDFNFWDITNLSVGPGWQLGRWKSGGRFLYPTVVSPAAGDVLEILAVDDVITWWVNGVLAATITDSTHQTATLFGIGGNNAVPARYDDLLMEAR